MGFLKNEVTGKKGNFFSKNTYNQKTVFQKTAFFMVTS